MQSEIRNGDRPALTSLVGASAAPSQTPAANPHTTPRPCPEAPGIVPSCLLAALVPMLLVLPRSVQRNQQQNAQRQHHCRHPEVNVRQHRLCRLHPRLRGSHPSPSICCLRFPTHAQAYSANRRPVRTMRAGAISSSGSLGLQTFFGKRDRGSHTMRRPPGSQSATRSRT